MSTVQLIRRGGLALILGGVLWGVAEVLWGFIVLPAEDPGAYPQPAATILWFGVLAALICILLGLPGLYSAVAGRSGRLGLVAFVMLFTGEVLLAGLAHHGAFIQRAEFELLAEAEAAGVTVEEPVLFGVSYLLAYGLHVLGWILFGVAMLRAGALPRWPVVLVMLAPLLLFVAGASGVMGTQGGAVAAVIPLLFGVGLAWLGLALLRSGDEREAIADEPATHQGSPAPVEGDR